jgi:hypothetical protein
MFSKSSGVIPLANSPGIGVQVGALMSSQQVIGL